MPNPWFAFILMACSLAFSATAHHPVAYHFSPDGQDTGSAVAAQSTKTPWRSISKLDAVVLFPGDSVLFNRGGNYPGWLSAIQSGKSGKPVYYGAYGKGSPPVISGALPVQGWKVFRDRIQVADAPRAIRQMFVDGKPMILARYPNTGYLPIQKPVGDDAFKTSGMRAEKPGSVSPWNGSSIHIKTERFSLDARKVVKFEGDSGIFHLDRSTTYAIKPGRGFFLNGALEALDTTGEWYYDASQGKVYAWMPFGDSAASHDIMGTVWDYGFRAENQNFLTIENLRFAYPATSGILLTGTSQIAIRKCSVEFPGGEGMTLEGRAFSLEDNSITGAIQAGILLRGSASRIFRNRVSHTGQLDRLGLEGFGGGCCRGNGIEFYGDSNLISENRLSATGYNGIRFGGVKTVVEKNFIDSSCMVLDDGAGIYTWAAKYTDPGSTGSVIRKNIIINTLGTGDGIGDTATSGHGIYLDHCVQQISITGNTVANADIGIYLHNTRLHVLSGNILYHNRDIQLYLKRDYLESEEMFGNLASGNVLFSTSPEQQVRQEKIYEAANPQPLAIYSKNYLCLVDSAGQSCTLDTNRVGGPSRTVGSRLCYNFAGETRFLMPIHRAFRTSPDSATFKGKKPSPFSAKILIPGVPDFLPASQSSFATRKKP